MWMTGLSAPSAICSNTELGELVDTQGGCATVQRNLNDSGQRLKLTGTSWILTKGSAKCCNWGGKIPHISIIWTGVKQLESRFANKDLGVLVHNKLHMRKQYALVTKKASGQQCRQQVEGVDPSSLLSTGETHLQCSFQLWVPQYRHGYTGASDRTRENRHTLKYKIFNLNIRKRYFTVVMVKQWSRLPWDIVEASSAEILKSQLDMVQGNLL